MMLVPCRRHQRTMCKIIDASQDSAGSLEDCCDGGLLKPAVFGFCNLHMMVDVFFAAACFQGLKIMPCNNTRSQRRAGARLLLVYQIVLSAQNDAHHVF